MRPETVFDFAPWCLTVWGEAVRHHPGQPRTEARVFPGCSSVGWCWATAPRLRRSCPRRKNVPGPKSCSLHSRSPVEGQNSGIKDGPTALIRDDSEGPSSAPEHSVGPGEALVDTTSRFNFSLCPALLSSLTYRCWPREPFSVNLPANL